MNTFDSVLSRFRGIKKVGAGWIAYCPAHDDKKASLTLKMSETGKLLVTCHAGCRTDDIVAAVGLTMKELFPPRDGRNGKPRIIAVYDYLDEKEVLLFQCVRFQPKDFRQRRPDPQKPGGWIWNLNGVRRVLYRLPELKASIASRQPILIAEGEKDVEVLRTNGFAATCNPLGAKMDGSSWLPEYTELLRGAAAIVVISDKDEVGREHSCAVASMIANSVGSVKVMELPDRNGAKVKDTADFFAAEGTSEELQHLIAAAPAFPRRQELETPAILESGGQGRKSAATRLIEWADDFEFFHDSRSQAFVRLTINDHLEVWPVESTQFRRLLAYMYYKRMGKAVTRNAINDAVNTLAARACHDRGEEPVFLRVAPYGKGILIDLCDPKWRVVEVTATGWRSLDKSPVAFIRTGSMQALPEPTPTGSIEPLWELLNVTPAQRPLVGGAVLNYFHPSGPYFVTNFVGEQGSAKSCAARILRMLVDPNSIPLRAPPRDERDLLVHAVNNRCVVLDNLSRLPPWMSDGLCRLATGGGHSARQLYTDGEEFSLSVKRPVILNGIEDVAARPDLAERALQIELETIHESRRMSERELWDNFEAARAGIFSAVLNGLVCALREWPNLKLHLVPRMADAAIWATAGETAFGFDAGAFMSAYRQNLSEGAIASVDAHPVGLAIRQLLEEKGKWEGEATDLLDELNGSVFDDFSSAKNWPQGPRALSQCLRRLAPAFRRSGFEIDFHKGRRRLLWLSKRANFPSFASAASSGTSATDAVDAKDASFHLLHDEVSRPTTELFEELI